MSDAESVLLAHLRAMHSVEEFDAEATEESLTQYHVWDHETGEIGPEHDVDDLQLIDDGKAGLCTCPVATEGRWDEAHDPGCPAR